MLQLRHVTKTYRSASGSVTAVDDLSLEVSAGEFVALRGPSGCGKSTTLFITGGLLTPDSGSVRIAETDLFELDGNDRARFRNREIGFVFQRLHLVPYLSVFDNIRSPSLVSAVDSTSRARQLVSDFGLEQRAAHRPAALSVGEQQRAAIARALLNEPRVLLADEPTGNLDPKNAGIVLDHLRRFANNGGCVLLVTHDDHAASRADRVIEICDGRLKSAAVV